MCPHAPSLQAQSHMFNPQIHVKSGHVTKNTITVVQMIQKSLVIKVTLGSVFVTSMKTSTLYHILYSCLPCGHFWIFTVKTALLLKLKDILMI